MEESQTYSVALVDDDKLILTLLADFLQVQDGFDMCFKAEGGEELIAFLEEGTILPDLLILDLKLKGQSGIEVAEHLKTHFPSIRILIVSSHYKKSFMGFMLKTGAAAFLPKGTTPEELMEALVEVANRGFYFRTDQMDVLRSQVSAKAPAPELVPKNALSEREMDVLRLICFQKTAKEIGEELFIGARTVEGHKTNLFVKTGARNLAGLVLYAIQHKLIDPDEIPLI